MNNGHIQPQQQQQQHQTAVIAADASATHHRRVADATGNARQHDGDAAKPRIVITEQPTQKALRFRYECEGRSAGSIPGASSNADTKTFPSIRLENYVGPWTVMVSCVTKEKPYRPHPHKLVGKNTKDGVCTIRVKDDTMDISFNNLGIQCVKKRDIEMSLQIREDTKVDPFRTKFSHKLNPADIDMNSVRLCFQVFIPNGYSFIILDPVVTDPISDKKVMSELEIIDITESSSSVAGGKTIGLFCEKVNKEDIRIRFYEEKNVDGVVRVVWEDFGIFEPRNVHKQTSIRFKTPPYRTANIDKPVKCFVQLIRTVDKVTVSSDPWSFEYHPMKPVRLCEYGCVCVHQNVYKHDDIGGYRKRTRMDTKSTLIEQLTSDGVCNLIMQPTHGMRVPVNMDAPNTFDRLANISSIIKAETLDSLVPPNQLVPQLPTDNSLFNVQAHSPHLQQQFQPHSQHQQHFQRMSHQQQEPQQSIPFNTIQAKNQFRTDKNYRAVAPDILQLQPLQQQNHQPILNDLSAGGANTKTQNYTNYSNIFDEPIAQIVPMCAKNVQAQIDAEQTSAAVTSNNIDLENIRISSLLNDTDMQISGEFSFLSLLDNLDSRNNAAPVMNQNIMDDIDPGHIHMQQPLLPTASAQH